MYIDGWVWHGLTVDIFLLPEWESVYVPAHSPHFNMEGIMVIFLYDFTKRNNSTKQPNPADAESFTVQLKNETSFLNPSFEMNPSGLTEGLFSPSAYNYCFVPYWQRYYYITDWTWKNGIWEFSCIVDVLASFKTEIGATSSYIVRAAGDMDGAIIDTFYPAKSNATIIESNVASAWYNVAPSGGSYILGCINYQSSDLVGAVAYYALTGSQLASILNYLFTDNIYNVSSISEIGKGLYQSLFNPFQYIVSCMWFPFTTQAFGSTQTAVKVGYWSTGVNGIMVTNLAEKTFVTATIPQHPQVSRGSYLNRAPYARHTLYIPPFGSIPIDTNFLTIGNYLYSAVLVDHITGQATIRVSISPSANNLNEYKIMTERSGVIGVPIQLAQILTDYMNTINSGLDTLSSIMSLNISGIFKGLTSAVESQMPKVSTSGANGSFIECLQYPKLISEFLPIVSENRTEYGRPLCEIRTINTLSGYMQCGENDHEFSATKTESEEINRFMSEGFFYE